MMIGTSNLNKTDGSHTSSVSGDVGSAAPDGRTSKVDSFLEGRVYIMPDGSSFFRNSPSKPDGVTIWQEMTSRSGQNLVQKLSQSKNRSSPNPESPVQDHGLSQNQNPGGLPYRPRCWGHPLEPKRSYPTRETTNAYWSNISG